MLQIKRTAITLEEEEMLELEQIVTDRDDEAALKFVRKAVYNKIARSQRGKLRPDLSDSA